MSAIVIPIRPKRDERVCRGCKPVDALKCERCARWACLHWVGVVTTFGRTSTICRWCVEPENDRGGSA